MQRKRFSDKKDVFKLLLEKSYFSERPPKEILERAFRAKEGIGVSFAFLLDEFGWDTVEKLYSMADESEKIKLESRERILDIAYKAAKFVLSVFGGEKVRVPPRELTDVLFFVKLLNDRPQFFMKLAQSDPEKFKKISEACSILEEINLL